MGEGNLAERGWSNGCLWGGETRPKNPWAILHTYRAICPPARSHFMRVCAPTRVHIRSLFGSMDGGGLTDAERDGQRFLADFKKRMGEEEAKAKEEAKVRRRARAAKAKAEKVDEAANKRGRGRGR